MSPEAFLSELKDEFDGTNQIIERLKPLDDDSLEKLSEIIDLLGTHPDLSDTLAQSFMNDGVTDIDDTLELLRANLHADDAPAGGAL